VGLKLNETHQLLAYADDVNLLRDSIDTIKKNPEILIDVGTSHMSDNRQMSVAMQRLVDCR
jgi:hypothetical protein